MSVAAANGLHASGYSVVLHWPGKLESLKVVERAPLALGKLLLRCSEFFARKETDFDPIRDESAFRVLIGR
jgi:hypothetical protein